MEIGTLGGGMKTNLSKGAHLLYTKTGQQSEAAIAGVQIAGTEIVKAVKMDGIIFIENDNGKSWKYIERGKRKVKS